MSTTHELREAATVLARLESKRPAATILSNLETREECACQKQVALSLFSPLNTGVGTILNNVCRGCREGEKRDRELARIVCWGCKKVVLRVSPHKDGDGFQYRADTTYHTNACPVCKPGTQASVLAEKMIWMKKQGRTL